MVKGQTATKPDPIAYPADGTAMQAARSIHLPADWKLELFAAEPLLSDPVAMNFDERGRLYIALHHRNRHGTEDSREHRYWREDDQAAHTVGDRLRYMEKWAAAGKKPMSYFTDIPDRIVCVEDRDGDGKADTSREIALFQEPLDGVNAGVLARKGDVWATCIPHLWHLKDSANGEVKSEKLLGGFGVKFTFHGHDMHGVLFGPDGRLYWSIGDRGYHVETQEGRVLENTQSGAVFRCEPDGSKMEVFCTGLRNPQELVFDDLGNLITVDNDNDAEDDPRLLSLLQGADYGWSNGNLWADDSLPSFAPVFRRPWYGDKLYEMQYLNQPSWVQPALGFITSGPAGLTREPGCSLLPEAYRGAYFVADWRGGRSNSPLVAFWLEPQGMGFKIRKQEDLLTGTLPTDATFGPDGRLYISDMVEFRQQPNGGKRSGRGWIWAVSAPVSDSQRAAALEVRDWLKSGFEKESDSVLIQRLAHPDYRIRLEAQFTLAERGLTSAPALTKVTLHHTNRLARIHALQALGQLQRAHGSGLKSALALLTDADTEMQAQLARQLVDHPMEDAAPDLLRLLTSSDKRSAYFAAQALGRLGRMDDIAPLADFLRRNDSDPSLRHAGIAALERMADQPGGRQGVMKLVGDASPSLRLAETVILRRLKAPEIAKLLVDSDSRVVREAIRAVNDLPIQEALPALATLDVKTGSLDIESARRVLNARYRLGRPEDAAALARFASNGENTEPLRREALAMLIDWKKPSPTDRVTGLWLPLAERDEQPARDAFASVAPVLIRDSSAEVGAAAVAIAARFGMTSVVDDVVKIAEDSDAPPARRAAALRALAHLPSPKTIELASALQGSPSEEIRIAARDTLAARDTEAGCKAFDGAMSGSPAEQRAALDGLGSLAIPAAFRLLDKHTERLFSGQLPIALALDVDHALGLQSRHPQLTGKFRTARVAALATFRERWLSRFPIEDPLRQYRIALAGGDAAHGRKLFHDKPEFQCLRCHKIEGNGVSIVGPDLTRIGEQQTREYLLRAIVDPQADIARGFEFATLTLTGGQMLAGQVDNETEAVIMLRSTDATGALKTLAIPKQTVRTRQSTSPMPALISLMTPAELRDLVEYVATQGPKPTTSQP